LGKTVDDFSMPQGMHKQMEKRMKTALIKSSILTMLLGGAPSADAVVFSITIGEPPNGANAFPFGYIHNRRF
jgi:hypothetical protein